MRSSGRVEESYIVKIMGRKKARQHSMTIRGYLLQVMWELDLLCLPKVYDKGWIWNPADGILRPMHGQGFSSVQPVHVGENIFRRGPTNEIWVRRHPSTGDFTIDWYALVFRYGKSTKVSLYDGYTALQSGSRHLFVIQRESQAITVSFLHSNGPSNVDINLCRAVRLYFHQTIQRILSTYQIASDDVTDDLITITCRPQNFARQFDEGIENVRQVICI